MLSASIVKELGGHRLHWFIALDWLHLGLTDG
jgi:hypothetical protein